MIPTLAPYQQQTIDFVKGIPVSAITNEAGLGKTRCAIESVPADHSLLIVCPAHLITNWKRELVKWGYTKPCLIYSYQWLALRNNADQLPNFLDTVLIDESHYLKNLTTKRTKVVLTRVVNQAKKVVYITATPVKASALDIYPMLKSMGGFTGTAKEFAEKYCNKVPNKFTYNGFDYKGIKKIHAKELYDIWSKYAIRFKKSDVSTQLPPIVENTVYLDDAGFKPSSDISKLVASNTIISGILTDLEAAEYQETGLRKAPIILQELDARDVEPTIVFTHHRAVGDILVEGLKKLGHTVGLIRGGVSLKERTDIEDKFQSGQLNYIVANISAASTGLNLPAAKHVVFAELPWDYVDYYQGLNRAHRLTTTHSVEVTKYILDKSIDIAIDRTLKSKESTGKQITGEYMTNKKPPIVTPTPQQHSQRGHSVFSPSGSSIWIPCNGQPYLVKDIPEEPAGEKAIWGTGCHEQSEERIDQRLKGGIMTPYSQIKDEEARDVVKGYTEFVVAAYNFFARDATDVKWFIEERLSDKAGSLFGTLDFGAVRTINGVVEGLIIDLKTGVHAVSAVDNSQIAIYAKLFKETHGITGNVYTYIYGPRFIDNDTEQVTGVPAKDWRITPELQNLWDIKITNAHNTAKRMYDGELSPVYTEGKHCKWCKAKAICPTYGAALQQKSGLTILSNTPTVLPSIDTLTKQQRANLVLHTKEIEDYLSAVDKYVKGEISQGQEYPGIKMVMSRGRRGWRKDLSVEEIGDELVNRGLANPYRQQLVTLGDAEKVVKDLDGLVVMSEGGTALVPDTDKRQAVVANSKVANMLGEL